MSQLEEDQSRLRTADADADTFRNSVVQIKGLLSKVLELKTKGQTKVLTELH